MSKFSAFRQDPDDALAANANVPEPEEAGGAAAALERAQIPAAYSKFCMALSETLRHSPPLLSSSTPRPAGAAAWRGLRGRRCWRRLRALGQAEPHRGKGEERRDGTGCGMMRERDGAGWCGDVLRSYGIGIRLSPELSLPPCTAHLARFSAREAEAVNLHAAAARALPLQSAEQMKGQGGSLSSC